MACAEGGRGVSKSGGSWRWRMERMQGEERASKRRLRTIKCDTSESPSCEARGSSQRRSVPSCPRLDARAGGLRGARERRGLGRGGVLLLLAAVFGLVMHACAAPPVNDKKVNAVWVTSYLRNKTDPRAPLIEVTSQGYPPGKDAVDFQFLNFTATGSNLEATMEYFEPSHGSRETGASVWWRWKSPVNGTIRVSTVGSTGDTAVAVYTSRPWDGIRATVNAFGVHLESFGTQTDDVLPNELPGLYSVTRFLAWEGMEFLIAVGGFRSSQCSHIQLSGVVEDYTPPPESFPRVSAVSFSVADAYGNALSTTESSYDEQATISLQCSTPGAWIFYTRDQSSPNVKRFLNGDFVEWPVGGATIRWTGEAIAMDNVVIRAQAYKKGLDDSFVATSPRFNLRSMATEIFPDGGSFHVEVLVSISSVCDDGALPNPDKSATRGPLDRCVVHYTIDGTEPSLRSPRYSVPLLLRNVSNLTVRSRLYTAGMVPSLVTTSKPFNVSLRAEAPAMTPPGSQCRLEALDETSCKDHVRYDHSVTVSIATATPGAAIYYNLDLALTGTSRWTPYTAVGLVLGPGVHRVRAVARKEGWLESAYTTRLFEVNVPVVPIALDRVTRGVVAPMQYQYYVVNITNVRSDIRVTVTRFFGLTDIFLSAHVMRPLQRNLTNVYSSRAGGGEGDRLTVLHSEFDFDVDERRGTPVYVAIRGASGGLTQYLIEITAEISPIITIGGNFEGQVSYGKWTYFKFYMGDGSPSEEPMRGGGIRLHVQQHLALPIGLRVSFKEGVHPTDASVGLTVIRGDATGTFDLPIRVTQRKAVYYVGVRGLYAIAPVFNFTLAISPYLSPPTSLTSPPPRNKWGTPPCIASELAKGGGCFIQDMIEGVLYKGKVETTRFAYFRVTPTLAGQSVDVKVTETGKFTGGLRVLIQQDVYPSLLSHINTTVTSTDAAAKSYMLHSDILPGHSYVIGVYAHSYAARIYNFTVSSKFTTLPSTPRPGGKVPKIFPMTNNFRYFYSIMQQDTYKFYSVDLPTISDLTIQMRISGGGLADMYVSNTNAYPTASREGVQWISLGDEGLNQINVYQQSEAYKLGVYYIGIYARTYIDFGITAYLDKSATSIQVGSTYGIVASTYSYRYYTAYLERAYAEVKIEVEQEVGRQFLTVLMQYGRRPTQTDYIYYSSRADAKGLFTHRINFPDIGQYFIMVHLYPPGYSGPVLNHQYRVSVQVDTIDPPGYRQFPNIPGRDTFVVSHDKYYAQLGYPIPEPWDIPRPQPMNLATLPLLELGRATLFSFSGHEWVYARFYLSSFRIAFTVDATALTPGLEIMVAVRRGLNPTLVSWIAMDDTPDAGSNYRVRIPFPVVGAFYNIGVYARQRQITVTTGMGEESLVGADVALLIKTEEGSPVMPPVTQLINYFVSFEQQKGLTYRFFTIDVPADGRDVSVSVTRLNKGVTDIVVSNSAGFPTMGGFSIDEKGNKREGWWRSESAAGQGEIVIIRNYEEGYKSPGTYNIGVFALSYVNYFILVRLDRPPPTIKVNTLGRGKVAASAFSNFRFVPGLPSTSKIFVVIKQAPPHTSGLKIYLRQFVVPSLTQYDSASDVSDANGNYVVAIDRPQPDALIYVGVFGLDVGLISEGLNYYFSMEALTDQMFKNYVSSPYIGYTADVIAGPNDPPQPATYQVLYPDTLVTGELAGNATAYYRVQIVEETTITLLRTDNGSYVSLYARQIKLPYPGTEPSAPKGFIGVSLKNQEFTYEVCGSLSNASGTVVKVMPQTGMRGAVGSSGCARGEKVELNLSPNNLLAGSYFYYLAVHFPGCVTRSPTPPPAPPIAPNKTNTSSSIPDAYPWEPCPPTAHYSIIASRRSRSDPPQQLRGDSFSVSGDLAFPGQSNRYFSTPDGSRLSYYFSLSVTKGYIDMFLSALHAQPKASDVSILPSHRSVATANNPPIAFHPDEKPKSNPDVPVYLSLMTASKASRYTLTFLALPHAHLLTLSHPVNGKLNSPVFTNIFAGWSRKYYRIAPGSLGGEGGAVLTVRPTETRCGGKLCTRKECCGGKNPFGFFDVLLQRGKPPSINSTTSGFLAPPLSWRAGPNADCAKSSRCTPGAQNMHCEGACSPASSGPTYFCCEQFTAYTVHLLPGQVQEFTDTLYVAVQGRANGTERRTDTFMVELLPSEEYTGIAVGQGEEVGEEVERFEFQVGGGPPNRIAVPDGGDSIGKRGKVDVQGVTERVVEMLELGVERKGMVGWGEWRLFEWVPHASGVLRATVKQHVGTFGLRIIARKDSRPLSLSHYAETCMPSSHASPSGKQTGNCSISVPDYADVETKSDRDPSEGANASLAIRVTATKKVTVAVFGASSVYSPFAFSFSAQFDQTLHAAAAHFCREVNASGVFTNRLGRAGEYSMLRTPPVSGEYDLTVTAEVADDPTVGTCMFGGGMPYDGLPCYRNESAEVWTGLGKRNPYCKGCWWEEGWDYPVPPLYKKWAFTYFDVVSVPSKRCFENFEFTYYTVILFTATSPFITVTTNETQQNQVCEIVDEPTTFPKFEYRPLPNYVANSHTECCERCNAEPTCSSWTHKQAELCWTCVDQDISIDLITVQPGGPVKFMDAYNTSWTKDVGMKLVRGPRCYQAVAPCCTLSNATMAVRHVARVKAVGTTTISGTVGQCARVPNGDIELLISNTLDCPQVTRERAGRDSGIQWEGAAKAPENLYDARQRWILQSEARVCTQRWLGLTSLGSATIPGVVGGCVKESDAVLRLATLDEEGVVRCLGVNISAYVFSGGRAIPTWYSPHNVTNQTVGYYPCTTDVFKTASNISDPARTVVYLAVNKPSEKKLLDWTLSSVDGTLRLQETTDVCLIFTPAKLPVNTTHYPGGVVVFNETGSLASCNYSRALGIRWSVDEAGKGYRLELRGRLLGCLGMYKDCPKLALGWTTGCTYAPPRPTLLPCDPLQPSFPPIVAASSSSYFIPNRQYVISTRARLPSVYTLRWKLAKGHVRIEPGGVYASTLTAEEREACYRVYHDLTQEGYVGYVHQRGVSPSPLLVTVRFGLCSFPPIHTASSPANPLGAYVVKWNTGALPVTAFTESGKDVSCLCVALKSVADAPAMFTVQVWPQENGGSEPAPPLPPIIGGGVVGGEGDDAWLVPGEAEQVLLGGEMGAQNASWMLYVREALVVSADVLETQNCQGCSIDLHVGHEDGYEEGKGGDRLYLYAEDGPLLTVWATVNFSNATSNYSSNTSWIRFNASLFTAAKYDERMGVASGPTVSEMIQEGSPVTVVVAERVGARRSAYLSLEAPPEYTTVLSVDSSEGAADVILVKSGGNMPSRTGSGVAHYRSDHVNGYPDLVLEVGGGLYSLGVFADLRSNITLSIKKYLIPPLIQYGSVMKIAIQPGQAKVMRVIRNILASPSVHFSVVQTAPLPLNTTECPFTLAVRAQIPPSPTHPGTWAFNTPIALEVRSFEAETFVASLSRCYPGFMGTKTGCEPLTGGPCDPEVVAAGGGWTNCSAVMPEEGIGGHCEFRFVVTTP